MWKTALLAMVMAALTGAVAVFGMGWTALFAGMPVMPAKELLWALNREPAIEFIDEGGSTISVQGPRYGRAVAVADLPAHVANAFIAAEDGRFRQHTGVDARGVVRAMVGNIQAGHTVQGGSTITQQLVKNLFMNQDQTIQRKAQEAKLAVELERVLSKNQILDLYLNRIYFGATSYGLDAAAHTYFGKDPAELTLSEAAMLASLPKSPSRFANDRQGVGLRERQHYVLDQMVSDGYASVSDADTAKNAVFAFAPEAPARQAAYAVDYALAQLHQLLPELPPDAVVKLSIDADLQAATQVAMNAELVALNSNAEGAVVLLAKSGAIRVMVGGRDHSQSEFNRATHALRQPGSAFKVFVYAAALESGMTPRTIRVDAPLQIGDWKPRNYRDEYLGPVTLTQALAKSLNTVAVQVGAEVGTDRIVALARRFGVQAELHGYPSIALGTGEVTLMDMTTGFGVLARNGLEMSPYIIEEVRNSKGDLFYSRPVKPDRRVYSSGDAQTMTGMLRRVVTEGTGRQSRIDGRDIAGKTGTSQNWRDAWFLGYSAQFVAGVWVGNDDDAPLKEMTGGAAPARIFARAMANALSGLPAETLLSVTEDQLDPEREPEPAPVTSDAEIQSVEPS